MSLGMRRDDGAKQEGMTLAWFLVRSFTALSVLFNCAHAVLVLAERGAGLFEKVMAVFVAALFPVALLVTTELALRLIRGWPRGQRWYLAAGRLLVIAGVVTVGIVAFFRSYGALRDMGQTLGIPAAESWMLPVVVDLVIVFGTIAVLVLETQAMIEAAERQAAESVEASAEPVIEQPTEPVEQVSYERPTAPAVEHLVRPSWTDEPRSYGSVEVDRAPDRDVVEQPVREPVRADESVAEQVDEFLREAWSTGSDLGVRAVEQTVDLEVAEPVEQPAETVEPAPYEWPSEVADRASFGSDDRADEHVAELTERADESADRADEHWRALADRVRSTTGITADPDELARVLEMDSTGASRAKIAEAVGRSKSTVTGWIARAAEVVGPLEVAK